MHVMITGSRDWPMDKAHIIWEALEEVWTEICGLVEDPAGDVTFHHGECPYGGADLIGASWAAGAGWKVVPHPPEVQEGWAYAARNQDMVDMHPQYVVACFLEGAGNRGTTMTYKMAEASGLNIKEVWG